MKKSTCWHVHDEIYHLHIGNMHVQYYAAMRKLTIQTWWIVKVQ